MHLKISLQWEIVIFGFESVALTTAIPNGKHLIYFQMAEWLDGRSNIYVDDDISFS